MLAARRVTSLVRHVAPRPNPVAARRSAAHALKRHAHNLVFLGAPGAGKGTYASRVAPALGIPHISTGDLIRAEIQAGSDVGLKIKAATEAGDLVDDQIVLGILRKRLEDPDTKPGVLLDGFPRTAGQAELLAKFLDITLVLNVDLKEKYLIQKILGRRVCSKTGKSYNIADIRNDAEGVLMPPLLPPPESKDTLVQRADDTEEVIKNRLRIYHETADPLMKFYDDKGVLRHFEVKKGLDDLPQVMEMLGTELGVDL